MWFSFDGARVTEFPPDKGEAGYSLTFTAEQPCIDTGASKVPKQVVIDMKCNKDIDTLKLVEDKVNMCQANLVYESAAGCTYWTLRPFLEFIDRVKVLTGILVIIIGLLNLLVGKVIS